MGAADARDYSVSGDFGETKFYPTAIVPETMTSLDRIRLAGWHRVNSLYRIERPNGSDLPLIIATLSGTGYIQIHKNRFSARPGTVFVIPDNCPSAYGAVEDGLWEFQWIHYSGLYAESCTKDLDRIGTYFCDVGRNGLKRLLGFFDGAQQKGLEKAFADAEALDAILHCVLKRAVLAQASPHLQIADEMIDFVEHAENFRLDDLVNQYYFSKEYLIRLFKKRTGLTPYQYWKEYRLKHSCAMLEQSEKNVEEIARSLGYRNAATYITQFKKCIGVTPAKYRRDFFLTESDRLFSKNEQ